MNVETIAGETSSEACAWSLGTIVIIVLLHCSHPPRKPMISITMMMVASVMSDRLSPRLLDCHHSPPLLGQLHPGLGDLARAGGEEKNDDIIV